MPIFPSNGGASLADIARGIKLTHTFYVNVAGDDSADGISPGTGFKTIARGVQATNAVSGGKLIVEYGAWPHTLAGSGLWLRGIYDTGPGGDGWIDVLAPLELYFLPGPGPTATGGFGIGGGASDYIDSPFQVAGLNAGLVVYNLACSSIGSGKSTFRIGLSSPQPAWNNATVYANGNSVSYSNVGYVAQIPDAWDDATEYDAGDKVLFGTDCYVSATTNTNSQPDTNPGDWTAYGSNTNQQPDTHPLVWYAIRPAVQDGLTTSLTSMIRFENVFGECGGVDSGAVFDFGYFFWGWFNQVRWSRYSAGSDELKNCGVRCYNVSGNPTYLTFWRDGVIHGGGFYSVGDNEINAENYTGEDMIMDMVHAFTDTGSSLRGEFKRLLLSDSDPNRYAINNEGIIPLRVVDCDRSKGAMQAFSTTAAGTGPYTNGLLEFGQYGIWGASSQLDTSAGRRMHSPTAARYKNIAQPMSALTVTGRPIGPDGVDGSVTLNTGTLASGTNLPIYDSRNGFETPSEGDYLAWGTWVLFPSGSVPTDQNFTFSNVGSQPFTVFLGGPTQGSGNEFTLNPGEFRGWFPTLPGAGTSWLWIGCWIKFVDYPAGAEILVQSWPNESRSYAKPWCIRVPAADEVTGREVAELMLFGSNSPNVAPDGFVLGDEPSTPPPGTLALWPGQRLVKWDPGTQDWIDY